MNISEDKEEKVVDFNFVLGNTQGKYSGSCVRFCDFFELAGNLNSIIQEKNRQDMITTKTISFLLIGMLLNLGFLHTAVLAKLKGR